MFRVLVVDADRSAGGRMEELLTRAGYEPILASGGPEALETLARRHIDLILLDPALPGGRGYELIGQLRREGHALPLFIVTAERSFEAKKRCFQLGADDYLTKPVEEEELLLRMTALLRRARLLTERRLVVGQTELEYDSLCVRVGGSAVTLPKKEFLLLYKLLSYPNKTFTRRQLMDEIWDLDSESDEHTVNVHIGRLRERFRGNPDFQILTVRGFGYRAVLSA